MNRQQLLPRIKVTIAELANELQLVSDIKVFGKADRDERTLHAHLGNASGTSVRLVIVVCANPRMAPIQLASKQAQKEAAPKEAIPVVAGSRLGQRVRRWLRENDVGYLDLHGHTYLRGPGVIVDREPSQSSDTVRWDSAGSPFADRSSLLIRHLVNNSPIQSGVRHLAEKLNVSAALVSRTINRLKQDGYVSLSDSNCLSLQSIELLLQDWADFYHRRAKRQREKQFYVHARDANALMRMLSKRMEGRTHMSWALSYQAGASLVSPFAFFSEVHVLVGSDHWDSAVSEMTSILEAEPAQTEVNLVLIEPYYRHSWNYGVRTLSGLQVVSDIQLYLDLSRYPRRGAEQAARISERIAHAVEHPEGM